MDRPLLKTFHLHRTRLNRLPTEFLSDLNLTVNRNGPFIGNTH